MKGLAVAAAGGPFELKEDIVKPTPASGQVLVKSIYAPINPVESFMQGYGLLVTEWPIVLGCDAGGVVVELGEGVTNLKVGDGVFGCTRLGFPGHGTLQEYFVMDADLAWKRPDNISLIQASTIGVGLETAALGILDGFKVVVPAVTPAAEWLVVLGGAGSVGQFSVQLATLAGFKVVATCSEATKSLVKGMGAKETVDYRLPEAEQIEKIAAITGGKFGKVFDTVAKNHLFAFKLLREASTEADKIFSTPDDWTPFEEKDYEGITNYRLELGPIGRTDTPQALQLNSNIKKWIAELSPLIESGSIKPSPYEIIGPIGFSGFDEAYDKVIKGVAGGKKLVLQLAEE